MGDWLSVLGAPFAKALGPPCAQGLSAVPPFLLRKQDKLSGFFIEIWMEIFFSTMAIIQGPWHRILTLDKQLLSPQGFSGQGLSCTPQPFPTSLPTTCLHASWSAHKHHEFVTLVSHRHNHRAHCLFLRPAGTGPLMSKGYPEIHLLRFLGRPSPHG